MKTEGATLRKRSRVEAAAPLRFRIALPEATAPFPPPPTSKNKKGLSRPLLRLSFSSVAPKWSLSALARPACLQPRRSQS
jgi:hypothetical protein